MLLEFELGALEALLDPLQTVQQRLAIRGDDADRTAQHQGVAGRQVELGLADIDPHVVGAGKQIRVAGEAAAHQIEIAGRPLIGDLDIDVLEPGDIAEVLGGAIERIFH